MHLQFRVSSESSALRALCSQEECPFSSPARVRESPLFSWNATFEPNLSVFPTLSLLCVCLENATRSGRVVHTYNLQSVRLEPRATKRSTLTCCPDPDTVRTRESATVSLYQELSSLVNIVKKRPWYEIIQNHCGSRKAAPVGQERC